MIGIVDSGVGGLSIYREIKKICPSVSVIYLSDSKNFPYGEKSQIELEQIVEDATRKLLESGVDTIVVACNSATVSSIDKLRSEHPEIIFIGIEPAIKLAAKATKTGKVGLLATQKTVKTHDSEGLSSGVEVIKYHDAALIKKIEDNIGSITETDLEGAISPFLEAGTDVVVLGCTHFYFIKEALESQFPEITFIEPAEYVAKSAIMRGCPTEAGADIFITTGDLASFSTFIADIIGINDADIRKV